MSTLSPAAQAVLDAAFTLADNLDRDVTESEMIAAALRAAADYLDDATSAHTLYAISDELEGVDPFDEEENDRRFQECMSMINNLQPGDITKLMGEAFMKEFRRVSQ